MSSSSSSPTTSTPTSTTTSSSTSTGNILKKLQGLLQNGQHYDAQQMVISLHHRNLNQKKFEKGVQLLFVAIRNMFQYGQSALALELGRCMIELFEKMGMDKEIHLKETSFTVARNKSPISAIELLETIAMAFPETEQEKKITFIKDAIKFTKTVLKRRDENGDARLHHLLANEYWKMGEHFQAHKEFVRADGDTVVEEHTKLLIEWAQQGENERDLFIARATLHLLCRQKLEHAREVFAKYMSQWETDDNQEAEGTPLTHFIKFLFIAVDHKHADLFRYLLQQYKPTLDRDESLKRYLDQIGIMYMGIKQQRPQQGGLDGMLSTIMSSLFNSTSASGASSQ